MDRNDPAFDEFVRHVREDTVTKMVESATVTTLSPGSDAEPDIKLAVETGLAILLDKPIIVLDVGNRGIPPGLRRVAHAIIEVDEIDTTEGQAALWEKLKPLLDEFSDD